MSRLLDLTGQKFGSRTVLRKVSKPGQQAHWLVRCGCGKEDVVPSQRLRNGGGKACRKCGRATFTKVIDLEGQQFGKWTVLGRDSGGDRASKAAHWSVECECGRKGVVLGSDLRSGHSKSCESCGSTKYDYKMDLSNPDWCWLLGLFHGDGSTFIFAEGGGTVTFSCTPPENQTVIQQTLKSLGIQSGVTKDHVNVYSVRLARDLARFKVSSRENPRWMFPEEPSCWASWLAGLLDADGCVSKTGRSIVYYQFPHGGLDTVCEVLDGMGVSYSTGYRQRENTQEESVSILASGRARFVAFVAPRFPKRKTRLARLKEAA